MAHIRTDCKNLSTTISLEEEIMDMVENYRFDKRKNNRSAAIAELILKGLKYDALVQKRKARNVI
jgi:metal-responsive CopG/Arc/MetJ family transcriptional regulator